MKKCFALMLAVLLLLSMTGCATLGALALPSATPTPEPTAAPTAAPTATPAAEPTTEPTSEPTPEPTSVPTTIDDYVGLYSHTELSYSDANGGYSYNYIVPQFLLDTEDAKAANADIQERCLPRIEAMKEAAEQGYSLTLLGISYDAWLEDGLVTLILTVSYDAGCTYYTVYRLQAETGALLSNEDMAARLGVSMEQYTPSRTKRCPRSLKACGAAHGTRAAQLSTTSSLKTRFPTRMCGRHSFIWIKTVCPAYNAKSIRLPVQAATNICSRCRSAEYREAIFE